MPASEYSRFTSARNLLLTAARVRSTSARIRTLARLGHRDACTHYLRALGLLDEGAAARVDLLLELGAAHERTGMSDLSMDSYREAADLSRSGSDMVKLAAAALGMQSLGQRSGADNVEVRELLRTTAQQLEATQGPSGLQSRVLSALTRVLRHGSTPGSTTELMATATRAIKLATSAGNAHALATAKLAMHDAMWTPGTARSRLPVIDEMLDAALTCGDADLIAEAHLLRATALLELGDPAGRDQLVTYIEHASQLGHARGRWGALTRRATYAQLAGQTEEAARFGEEGLELGLAIGEPDAVGCFCTSRWSLVALGVRELDHVLDDADPLWPLFPLVNAWPFAARGEAAEAAAILGDFSVVAIGAPIDLEQLAIAAAVFAVAGSDDQRTWVYDQLRPYAGTHVIVGGCAAYHAALDPPPRDPGRIPRQPRRRQGTLPRRRH